MEESSLGACAVVYSSPSPSPYAAQTWRDCPPFSAGRGGSGRGARRDCKHSKHKLSEPWSIWKQVLILVCLCYCT